MFKFGFGFFGDAVQKAVVDSWVFVGGVKSLDSYWVSGVKCAVNVFLLEFG